MSSSVPVNTLLNKLPKGKLLSSLDEETVSNLLSEIVLARREGLSCTSSAQFLLLTVLQHDKEVLLINSKVSASNHRLSEQRDAPQRSPPQPSGFVKLAVIPFLGYGAYTPSNASPPTSSGGNNAQDSTQRCVKTPMAVPILNCLLPSTKQSSSRSQCHQADPPPSILCSLNWKRQWTSK